MASAARAAGSLARSSSSTLPERPDSPSRPDSRSSAVVDLVERGRAAAQQVEDRGRVERARARRHRHALERAESHGRVERAAVADGAHGAAAAEVADDQPRDRHLLGGPLHARGRESRSGGCATACASARHGVRSTPRRASSRGTSVSKTATCGSPGSARRASSIAASAGALCSGARSTSERNSRERLVVEQHRLAEARRRRGRRDGPPRRRRPGASPSEASALAPLVLVDRRELEARRAGVDDEDAAQAIRPARSSPRRRAGPRRARACTRGS